MGKNGKIRSMTGGSTKLANRLYSAQWLTVGSNCALSSDVRAPGLRTLGRWLDNGRAHFSLVCIRVGWSVDGSW